MKKSGTKLHWNEIGSDILTNMYHKNMKIFNGYYLYDGINTMFPYPWTKCLLNTVLASFSNYQLVEKKF